MSKRKICVVLTDRANFGRLWPVMRRINAHPGLALQTMCAGSMVLERFGLPENMVLEQGFTIDSRVYMELEGGIPSTMAKSIGHGIVEITSELQHLKPDVILLIGDRYEALAAAIAAAYLNISIAHIQGGEVSGSIDESARHAITKFAHFHFPSTQRSAEYIVRMGEDPANVFMSGCPCGDFIADIDTDLPDDIFNSTGVGANISPNEPYLLVIIHPVTTEIGKEKTHVTELIHALDQLKHPTVWLWPNIDAGADHISHRLRIYREHNDAMWLRLVKNFDPVTYQKVLMKAACAVGNSSSFIRDSSFSGTPVVIIGNRQYGREHGENVKEIEPDKQKIVTVVKAQLENGRYEPSSLYGNGGASKLITEKLAELKLYKQKRLHYIYD